MNGKNVCTRPHIGEDMMMMIVGKRDLARLCLMQLCEMAETCLRCGVGFFLFARARLGG